MKRPYFSIGVICLTLAVISISCKQKVKTESAPQKEETQKTISSLPIDRLNLPEGFRIEIFAEGIDDARSMALGDKGTLFVGTRRANKLYALQDTDGDYRVDKTIVLDTAMQMPNGVAFRNGSLYVAEVNRLLKYDDIESQLDSLPEPEVIYDDYPTEYHHGWKYIAFGPDDKLYVPVGAPCNICDSTVSDKRYAAITRMNADGSNREIYAHGVRNTVGFTWHPETHELWFTDNGRDMMGDDIPPCELNRASEMGQHFGYPFCHGDSIKDPEFGDQRPCSEFEPPAQNLGAHVAPLAVKFYRGDMFPEEYKKYAFIAEHGSWNRSKKVGYRIALVALQGNEAVSYSTFIDGWLDDETQEQFGRPVDMLFLKDGSMLISDDYGDAIYRVSYANMAEGNAQ
ncbi:sorbosone dehydrogenase family protein [Allomuricauda sp. SCSIO 65647]|uniref:PQQ-dependent sugar dehydrogenase n=1 Tax=Allomuricauda sp. SCSIO 65647 TaxID=2908843 RepID=UPI001F29D345|nr:sorbosone dehydrogenase family protein [Muricauda sp. SCSIO 65647]UJH67339.1 sorbosone dehydrogenase family protein [Muricauda sp. SCSIO 65647]